MNRGIYISGVGHICLILWLLLGGMFAGRKHDPIEVAQVSLVSSEEFAAMSALASAPRATAEAPAPMPQAKPDVAAAAPAPETPPAPAPQPAPAKPAKPDPRPDLSAVAPPPKAEVTDKAPTPPAPPRPDDAPPVLSDNAKPKPVQRVAPTPAERPQPDAKVDDRVTTATAPTAKPDKPAPKTEESTAPQEAATQIVTEAEQDKKSESVMASSVVPRERPDLPVAAKPAPQAAAEKPAPEPAAVKPAPQQTAAAKPAPASAVDQGAVNNALAQALGGGSQSTDGNGSAPVGPPMTQGEKDGLRLAVRQCWVVDAGSEAGRVTVTIAMSMNENGTVAEGSLRMVSNSGGSEGAVNSAFQAARRAILRCQKDGFDLPQEKYAQWRDIEMTFNPEKMGIK